MKNSSILLACLAFSTFALSATAFAGDTCPNFAGKYQVTSDVENGVPQPVQNPAILTITQKACQEVVMNNGNDPTPSPFQDIIVDGQTHVAGGMSDVGVTFTMTSHFDGNSLIAFLGMTSQPGQKLGTLTIALSPDQKTLTYGMVTPNETFTMTAVRQ